MMLLKKILPLKAIEKIINQNISLEEQIDKLRDDQIKYNAEISVLKEKIFLLEKHNKHIVADTLMIAQNLATIYSVLDEHNEIINDVMIVKKTTYH